MLYLCSIIIANTKFGQNIRHFLKEIFCVHKKQLFFVVVKYFDLCCQILQNEISPETYSQQ